MLRALEDHLTHQMIGNIGLLSVHEPAPLAVHLLLGKK